MNSVNTKDLVKLKFNVGRDNAMVASLRTEIDGEYGCYIVLADASLGVKAGIEYGVEMRAMKSKKGFIATKVTEVVDVVDVVIASDDIVNVNVKYFGEDHYTTVMSYNRCERSTIKEMVNKVWDINSQSFWHPVKARPINIKEAALKMSELCTKIRAGGEVGEIEDSLHVVVADKTISVHLKKAYWHQYSSQPIVSYTCGETSWENAITLLQHEYWAGAFIMPEEGLKAFIADYTFMCKKLEKEELNAMKKQAKKKFTQRAIVS